MNEEERILWSLIYAAAIVSQCADPGDKADEAVLRRRVSEERFNDNYPDAFPPETWSDEDIPL